jgi:hypothetical protein
MFVPVSVQAYGPIKSAKLRKKEMHLEIGPEYCDGTIRRQLERATTHGE